MSLLQEVAAVGTLFGLSLQIFDKVSGSKREVIVLGSLLNVSRVASGWKAFHTNYHALYRDVQAVVDVVTDYKNGQRSPKDISDIAPGDLRRTIFSGNLPNAVMSFKAKGRRQVRNIHKICGPGTKEFEEARTKLLGTAFESILDCVEDVCKVKDEASEIHDEFVAFLKRLDDITVQPNWGHNETSFVLDHYRLLSSKYSHVITCTDLALMNILDVYETIIEQYEAES